MKDKIFQITYFAVFMAFISRGACISCYVCGGLKGDDDRAYLPCRSKGESIKCHEDSICTKVHFQLTEPVDGKMEMEGMGCSFLDEYIAVCERSLDWMSQHLHLPIRSYTCYHCSDGDDCNLRKVGEMELTVDDRGRPQGLPGGEEPPYDHIWKCIHCGFFDPDNLRSVRACTEKEMVKECASTAEVCGLIYFELKKRPAHVNKTVFEVKQCIHKARYKKKCDFWTRRMWKLNARKLKCFYCEKDGCNMNAALMKDVILDADGATRPRGLIFFSIVLIAIKC